MFYRMQGLELLKDHLDGGGFFLVVNNFLLTVIHSFFLMAVMFFAFSAILAVLYERKISIVRYALTAALYSILMDAPIFLVHVLRPENITFHIEDLLVIYPPYFIVVLYGLCVYALKIDRAISISAAIKFYVLLVANILLYYMLEALFFYLLTTDLQYQMVIYFCANLTVDILVIIYCLIFARIIKRRKLWLDAHKFREVKQRSIPRALAQATLIAALLYALNLTMVQLLCHLGNILLIEISLFSLVMICIGVCIMSYYRDALKIYRANNQNQTLHIRSLIDAIDNMRMLRHDLNNIMQGYEGYIQLENWEGVKKYHASMFRITNAANNYLNINSGVVLNPALSSLISAKVERAYKAGIYLSAHISGNVERILVNELDLLRMVGILLDNAIEEAARIVNSIISFSLQETGRGKVLLSISNPTASDVDLNKIMEDKYTSKAGHSGVGLYTLWNLVSKTPGCRLRAEYLNRMITFYLELPCAADDAR